MSVPLARALRVVATLVVLATAAISARGQSISVDPYDPWNAMYRPFVFPTAPPNPAMPNQGRLDAISGPTAYGQFLDSVGAAGTADPFGRVGRPGGRFTPYWQSYRQLGATDRSYVPNRNDNFYEEQQKRQQALTQAGAIRDPRQRAAEMRRLRREGVEAARTGDSVRGGRRPAGRAPAPAAAPAPANPPAAPAATRPTTSTPSRGLLGSDPLTRELLTPSSNARSRAMQRRRPATTGEAPATGTTAP